VTAPATRAPTRRGEHREQRRESLLDAAVRVIRRRGIETSIEHVAAEVGVTRPIIYRYFGDTHGLRQAVAARFAEQLLGRIRSTFESAKPGTGRDVTRAAIDSYLAFVERESEVYRYLTRGPREEVASFADAVGNELASIIERGLTANGRDHRIAQPWAHGLVGMVHQAGDWWLANRTMSRRRLAEHLTALAWDGMGSGGEPANG